LFYQLIEANSINGLYELLSQIRSITSDFQSLEHEFEEPVSAKSIAAIYMQFSGSFMNLFAATFYLRTIDARILKSILSPDQYREIMDKGKELADSGYFKKDEE
jgi:hypothetical protein